MGMSNVSRRAFLGLSASAVSLAGLGLTACGGSSEKAASDGSKAASNTAAGVPATTPLDQLPIPEKGEVCNNPQDRDNLKEGGELVLPLSEITPNWNAFSLDGNTTYMKYLWNMYVPTLFRSDATGKAFEPNSFFIKDFSEEMADGKQVVKITFTDQAAFNDGTPMDYRCIESIYTTCSGKNEGFLAASTDGYQQIESVTKGDTDKQAVITFSTPYYPVQGLFTWPLHPASADMKVFNEGWTNEPHQEWGAGPFKIDQHDDTQVVFVPNEKWIGDKPMLSKVTFKAMEDQAKINALKNGEIDAVFEISGSAEFLSNFAGNEDLYIRRASSKSLGVIELNTARGSLKDIAVRKAVCEAVDIATILSIQFNGVNWEEETPYSQLIYPWQDGYAPAMPEDVQKLKSADERIAAAKKTLEDAGYTMGDDGYYAKDGEKVSFDIVNFSDAATTKNRTAAIQTMCKNAGMELNIVNKPGSEFSKTLTSRDWGLCLFAWNSNAVGYLNGGQLYGSESESNFTGAGTKEIDEGFLKATGIEDVTKQKKEVIKWETEAMKSYAYLPIFVGPDCTVCKKGLANFGPALFADIPTENWGWEKGAK